MGIFDGLLGLNPYQADASGALQAPADSGFLGNIYAGLQNNSDRLLGFGMGMLSGKDMQDGWRNAAIGMNEGGQTDQRRQLLAARAFKEAQQKKAYADFVAQNPTMAKYGGIISADPELGQKIIANEATRNPLDDEYKRAQIEELNARAKGKNATYGLNPVYGTRKNPQTGEEEVVILQPGTNGEIRESKLPEGVSIRSGIDKVDGGTVWYLYDKKTGQLVGTQPKDVGGEAQQKAAGTKVGEAIGGAQGGLSAALDSGNEALRQIDSVRNDPNRQRGTGMSSILNGIPGSAGRDFQSKVDQLKGGAFLQAYQALRGTGAIANEEGKKAEAAIARMDTATSEEAFMAALKDYENIIRIGMMRAKRMAGGDTRTPTTPDRSVSQPDDPLAAADAIVGR